MQWTNKSMLTTTNPCLPTSCRWHTLYGIQWKQQFTKSTWSNQLLMRLPIKEWRKGFFGCVSKFVVFQKSKNKTIILEHDVQKIFFFLKNMKNLFLCKGIPKSSFNLNGRPSRTQSRDVLKGNLGKFWKAHWRNPLKIFRWHFKTLKKAFQILLMKMGSLNHLSSLRSA